MPNAVPTIFPFLPKYLSVSHSSVRTTSCSTASARLEKKNVEIHKRNLNLFAQDSFKNFESFKIKIKTAVLPYGYAVLHTQINTQFHFIT